jgi:sugar lactone lactonase YvrE
LDQRPKTEDRRPKTDKLHSKIPSKGYGGCHEQAHLTGAGPAVEGAGNLYIVDTGNNQVMKLAAGATTPTPLLTGLNNPTDVAVDNAGNLYITDSGNSRVLMLPAG